MAMVTADGQGHRKWLAVSGAISSMTVTAMSSYTSRCVPLVVNFLKLSYHLLSPERETAERAARSQFHASLRIMAAAV